MPPQGASGQGGIKKGSMRSVVSGVAAAVLVALEGALAFLGLSVESPAPSWGNMINLARADLRVTIWPAVWPSLALVFTVFSLNNVGDFIRQRAQKRAAAI